MTAARARAVWVGIAVAAAGCARKDEPASGGAAGPEHAASLDFACQAARADDAATTIQLRGIVTVPPDRDAIVAAAVAGRVHAVAVKPGDRVAAGALIATIDAPDVQASAGEAEAARATAKAELTAADAALARAQHLVERGISPRRDLEDAQARRATAVAALGAATARTTLAQRQSANSRVKAPLAGVVLRVMKRAGELVDGTVGTPIVEIADPAVLQIRADVPATAIVHLGGTVTANVTIDAAPDRTFTADVIYISPAVDPTTGLGEVRATIHTADASDVTLALGLAGTLAIHVGTAKAVASVPTSALRRSASGEEELVVCRAVEHGTVADVRPVTTGMSAHGRIAILSGVAPGELVATQHVLGLEAGVSLTAPTP